MPLEVVIILGLAAPLVAIVAIIAAEFRHSRQLRHDRVMKELEFGENRWAKQRDDRLEAYSELSKLTKLIDVENEDPNPEFSEVLSQIDLLSEDPEMIKNAEALVDGWMQCWRTARRLHEEGVENPFEDESYKSLRALMGTRRGVFILLAKAETMAKRPGTEPDEAQEVTSKRRWQFWK